VYDKLSEHYPTHLSLKGRARWLFILPGSLLVCLLAAPLGALLWRAALAGMLAHLREPTALSALWLSLLTSTLSLLAAILTGTPLAYALARWPFRGRAAVELLMDLPVVLPPAVAGLALLIAFGRRGVFGGLLDTLGLTLPFTTAAVVVAQTFVAAPFYVRAARLGFLGVDAQLEEAAYTEGANQWQLFRYVMIPQAGRALLSGMILCWTRALGEFGATILFAGNLPGRTQTMPLAIYLSLERGVGEALALAAVLLLVSVILLAALRWLERAQEK
jgi:molybdate transport system permease protein